MKFEIEKELLAKAVEWVSKSLSPRPIIPALSTIKIVATKEGVSFYASDIENISETKELIPVEKEGKVLVYGSTFAEIVRSFPNKKITLEQIQNKLHISSGSTKFQIPLFKEDEMSTEIQENQKLGEVNFKDFFKAVSHVAVAAAREETSPMLTTIKITATNKEMVLEAVDRFRIAREKIKWETSVDDNKTVVIKAKTLSAISKTAEESEKIEIFSAGHEDSKTVIKAGKNKIMIQMLSGEFPATEKLFEQTYKEEIIADRKEVEDALNRMLVISKNNPVVSLEFAANKMKFTLTNEENEATEEIDCDYSKDTIKIKFNSTFLKEGISQFEEEKIKIHFEESTKTVRITGIKDQQNQIYLIVPIRE